MKPNHADDRATLPDQNIDIYLDVCHNEQGVKSVLSELTGLSKDKPLIIIFGSSIGKKVGTIFSVMEQYSEHIKKVYCL